MFDASVPIYVKAMKSGHAAQDTAAVCAVLEKMAGVKRGKESAPHSADVEATRSATRVLFPSPGGERVARAQRVRAG